MTPDLILGPVLAGAVRQLVRDELRATAIATPPPGIGASRWGTPPQVARETGVPVKTIRELVRSGRVRSRLRNRSASPKQPKYLVNADDVATTMEQLAVMAPGDSAAAADRVSIELKERAARIRAKSEGR